MIDLGQIKERADDTRYLAEVVSQWRRHMGISAAAASEKLGIPKRTLDGIEQGRGFRYPLMLAQAMMQIEGNRNGEAH